MDGFQAIILVCLNGTPTEACNEQTAVDVLSTHVATELGCLTGWQDVIARSAQGQDMAQTGAHDPAQTYIRTLCRRSTE